MASRQVVPLFEPWVSWQCWLVEYFPDCLSLPSEQWAPTIEELEQYMNIQAVIPMLVPADCIDEFAGPTGAGSRRIWTHRYGRDLQPGSATARCCRAVRPKAARGPGIRKVGRPLWSSAPTHGTRPGQSAADCTLIPAALEDSGKGVRSKVMELFSLIAVWVRSLVHPVQTPARRPLTLAYVPPRNWTLLIQLTMRSVK